MNDQADTISQFEQKTLGTIGHFLKGAGVRKDEANSGDIACVRYGELYTHHHDVIRKVNSRISRAVASAAQHIVAGDILFAGSGETKEEIGKCATYVDTDEAYAGGDIVILRPKVGNSVFLAYSLNAPKVQAQKASRGQGDAVVHISANSLARISLWFPPLPEQQAIAKALGDVDGLIASLEALIAKKRDIKQGAMQELLSGHRRLPGFKGEWQKVQLGRLCEMKSGETITSKRITDAGNYLCYGGNGRRGYTATFTHDGEHLLIGRVGALCGNINRVSGKFFASEHAIVGTCTPIADVDFLSLKLSTMSLGKMSEASAQPVLTVGKLKVVEIDIAKEIEEQREIAAVLLSMDAEIAALEAKLAKTRDLKQGMMQVLLTGEVRLV